MDLDDLRRGLPADPSGGSLLAVDCANEWRLGRRRDLLGARLVVDVDHHHDNTRFGDVNLVVAGRVVDR